MIAEDALELHLMKIPRANQHILSVVADFLNATSHIEEMLQLPQLGTTH
jgi:hypothetical protein